MVIAKPFQRALLIGSSSAVLLLACQKPPERPAPAPPPSTTPKPRADAKQAARCPEQLRISESLLPEWREGASRAGAEALANLIEACGDGLSPELASTLQRNIRTPDYKALLGDALIILLRRKQFGDAKQLIEKLSQDPKFLAKEERRPRVPHIEPLPTQQDFLRSMRSWITYEEALDFQARGLYARCAQQLSTLTHDDELRTIRPELLLQLGDCYEAAGDRAKADHAWHDAVAYSPALEIDVQQRQQRRP